VTIFVDLAVLVPDLTDNEKLKAFAFLVVFSGATIFSATFPFLQRSR
jgi:hypothetical protein